MIDSDDVDHFIFFFNPTTLHGFILWIMLVALLAFIASLNEHECAQMHCREGAHPALMDNQCLCVERAER